MINKAASGALALVLALAPAIYAIQPSALVAVPTLDAQIADASDDLRRVISTAMEEAAQAFGMTLDTSDLVYACRDDIVVVCAGATGCGEAIAPGGDVTDIGLLYISQETEIRFGDGLVGRRPPGFYAVRAAIGGVRNVHDPGVTILELAGSTEASRAVLPVELLAAAPTRRITIGLEMDPESGETSLQFGWHGEAYGLSLGGVVVPGA